MSCPCPLFSRKQSEKESYEEENLLITRCVNAIPGLAPSSLFRVHTHTNFLTYKYVRGRKYEEKKFCVFGLGYCNAVWLLKVKVLWSSLYVSYIYEYKEFYVECILQLTVMYAIHSLVPLPAVTVKRLDYTIFRNSYVFCKYLAVFSQEKRDVQ